MPLLHLASRIFGTPLLITRTKLDVILSVLGPRIGLPDLEMALPMPTPRTAGPSSPSGIAVIPVVGTLVKRATGLEAASGLVSYDEIGARLDEALADPQVAGILLDLDSPGGEAGGAFELAARVRAATRIKPVWAHANDAAYSAAYAIAAACQRLTLSQTAGVGSIGVIALHVDQAVKDAKDGLSYTAVYAGDHKNDFSPHEPLTPQARGTLQAEVNRLYDIFVAQVGQMRGLDPDAVRATEAAVYFGEHAVSAGLADAVMPFDRALVEFADALATKHQLATPQGDRRGNALPRASPGQLQPYPAPHARTAPHSQLEDTMNDHDDNAPTETTDEPTQAEYVAPRATPGEARQSDRAIRARIEAQAIAELCLLAGQPQRTAEFLAAGLAPAQVRRALLEARAEQPDISSRISTDTGTASRPEDSPVVAAVKKLSAKE